MRTIVNFNYHHFGLGIRYSNWSPKHHHLIIDILWLSITINWSV
jgi:hypothetical protein